MASKPTKDMTLEELDAWCVQRQAVIDAEKAERDAKTAQYKELVELSEKVYGKGSRAHRYVQKNGPNLPYRYGGTVAEVRRDWEQHQKDLANQARQAEQAQKALEYRDRCVQYLLDLGHRLGDSVEADDTTTVFTIDSAKVLAERVSFEKAMVSAEAYYAEHPEDHMEFTGHNCDDYDDRDCPGWNPASSHRCACGNRRVCWTDDYWTIDDEHPRAEAY